jgi:hypothetical protein
MQNFLGRFTSVASLAAAVGSTGCADNDSLLFIQGVFFLEAPSCEIQPEENAALLAGGGILDTALSDRYIAPLLVGNQITRRGSRDQVRTETSRVALKGAEVHVLSQGGSELTAFTTLSDGFVHPGTGEDPGFGQITVTLVPAQRSGVPAVGTGERVETLAAVRVFGETLGGQEVESNEYRFPVTLCNGCLIGFPSTAQDPTGDPDRCVGDPDDAPEFTGCFFGQDAPIDCRLCQGQAACDFPP